MYFHDLHLKIANEETRQSFLTNLSKETLIVIANDDDTIRMMMTINIRWLRKILDSLVTMNVTKFKAGNLDNVLGFTSCYFQCGIC